MKTIIYTSALILALGCGSGAVAQNTACKTKSCPDSLLLSTSTDGNYEVRKYLIKGKNPMEADYTVHFAINSAQLSESFADNAAQIKALKAFISQMKSDTLMRIQSVKVKGWASPDGNEASNQKLAKARATTFTAYLMAQCSKMKSYAVESAASVATWKDCLPMLEESSLAERKDAVSIINGNHTPQLTEQHLARLSSVWSYLKSDILPDLRCAEIEFTYCRSTIVEQRVLIEKPTPAPAPAAATAPATTPTPATNSAAVQSTPTNQQAAAQNKPVVIERQAEYLIIEDKRNGVIIEMDNAGVDWEQPQN